jgi:uncharacterized protein YndB with AHSA1/START domain
VTWVAGRSGPEVSNDGSVEELVILSIVVIVVLLIAAILIYAATKPNAFRTVRTATIQAPPELIFPLINDLHRHVDWNPFEKDPAAKRNFSGAPAGKGSVYEWDGNREVGAGRIEITDSVPSSRIIMKLDMLRPFKAHNTVEFTLLTNGNGTSVTWAMHGPQPYLAKLMRTFIDCDKMVGGQFEQGLATLQELTQKELAPMSAS